MTRERRAYRAKKKECVVFTGFARWGKVRTKTAIFDLVRECKECQGNFWAGQGSSWPGNFFVGKMTFILIEFWYFFIFWCLLIQILLHYLNLHFVNHENIVLWLTVLSVCGYHFLNFLNFLNSFEVVFVLEMYLKRVTFLKLVLKIFLNSIFFYKIRNQENLKRLRENDLYSLNSGKTLREKSLTTSINNHNNSNYEQQKFVSFVLII